MSDGLGSVFGTIDQAVLAIEEAVRLEAAEAGQVAAPPSTDMAGVYTAWEVLRATFNGGLSVRHNALTDIADRYRGLG